MSDIPNRVDLSNGSYLLFDYSGGQFRIAIYVRKVSKSPSLLGALSRALNKPVWDKQVQKIATYVDSLDKYEGLTLE